METVKKELTFNDFGVYKVDRIDDCMDWHDDSTVLEAENLEQALALFEKDRDAYALRFVPNGTGLLAYRGRLIAYKSAPFPIILPWVESVRGWSNEFSHVAQDEDGTQLDYVESIIYCCNDYFHYFPELVPEMHKKVLHFMLRIRDLFAAAEYEEADHVNLELLELANSYLDSEAAYRSGYYTIPLHKRYQFLEKHIVDQILTRPAKPIA